jgi:uncharacterized protein (TIGR02246 family)
MDGDAHTDAAVVAAIVRRIESAENAGDWEAMASMMADDIVIMVPTYPVQESKPACAAFTRDVLTALRGRFHRHIAYVSAEIRVAGDMAFDRGTFSFTVSPKAGGDTSIETGKYLFLYSRDGDRSWKIARVIVNLDEREEQLEIGN